MRSILVTGVQGVGKTTVTTCTAQILGVQCWDYADLMMRVDSSIVTKEDLRYIQWNHRQVVYGKVDHLLREVFWPGDGTTTVVLLENHLSVIDAEGIRTFSHEPIQLYNPIGLAIIEDEPATVVQRRRQDRQRDRHIGTEQEVAEQQAINLAEATTISETAGIPLLVVRNDDSERSARALATWARTLQL